MVYIFLAEGFEEIEALAVADILRRAGIETNLVSADNFDYVKGAHGITVKSDILVENIDYNFDMVVLPGGCPGAANLESNLKIKEIVNYAAANNKYISAICASPSILGKWGLLNGKTAVCYPSYEPFLKGASVVFDDVVQDGKIITSRGAGTAHKFAFKLVEVLKDKKTAENIKNSMIY